MNECMKEASKDVIDTNDKLWWSPYLSSSSILGPHISLCCCYEHYHLVYLGHK